MKITIISLDNWGFNDHIAVSLRAGGHEVHHINFHSFEYRYPNPLYKIYNFLLKSFIGKNVKHLYYGKEIIRQLHAINQKQDAILTLKGDFIDTGYIKLFKNFTDRSIAFFNDNVARYPKIRETIPYFDEVYSFEKEDCKKYKLRFLTNWIYNEAADNAPAIESDYEVFNISSKDKRLPVIYNIAKSLKSSKIKYKILVYFKNGKTDDTIEYISKKLPLPEVNSFINNSGTMLDINRPGQEGLSFRIFESLGLNKKLITTNADVVNYDFYNPNNILVVDEENPVIPAAFFENQYEAVPPAIYYNYTLKGWTKKVFDL